MRLKKKRQIKKKPIKRRKRTHQQAPPEFPAPTPIKLGTVAFKDPLEQIEFATKLAAKLKEIIRANNWFQPYEDKDHVRVEGWTMLGSLIGVTPVEEYVREIKLQDTDQVGPTIRGYEAKINLLCNGLIVGGASSECTIDEALWAGKDTFALRSMTLTRATSKAFRLNYGWIISLAGFDATPASDLINPDKKIVLDKPVTSASAAPAATKPNGYAKLFVVWPENHHGNNAFLFGDPLHSPEAAKLGLDAVMQQEFHAVFSDKWHTKGGWLIPAGKMEQLKTYLESKGMAVQVPKNPWASPAQKVN